MRKTYSNTHTQPKLTTMPLLTSSSCWVGCTPGWSLPCRLPGHTLLTPVSHKWACLLQPTSTPRSLCAGLLPSHSSPSLHLSLALLHPRCRVQHFDLLNSIPLINAQCSNLSRTLCKASHPLKVNHNLPSGYHQKLTDGAFGSCIHCETLELNPEEHYCWPKFMPWELTITIASKRPFYYLQNISLYLKKRIMYLATAQAEKWK